MGEELDGEDVLGDGESTVGRRGRMLRTPRAQAIARQMSRQQVPPWRSRAAPGVPYPGYGTQPLPLVPANGTGIFAAATTSIIFTARPQAPFHAERLLASVRRTGAAGITILASNFFIGRDLQLVEVGNFDVEFFGPTAFGVRLQLNQAEPGQLIRLDLVTSAVPAGADTLAVSLLLLGRTVT